MKPVIYLLNGPNLNLLGEREPEIYGYDTLADVEQLARTKALELGLELVFRQTNFEGHLIESIHEARQQAAGLIINPAGFSFTSVAILDALKTFMRPKIELHISNIHARDAIYHKSLMSQAVTSVICGLGVFGYEMAVVAMARLITVPVK